MGVASLVLGILSVIIGFIPFCGAIAIVPALVGLVLGIIDAYKKSKEGKAKGMALAGAIMSGVAIVVVIFWVFVFSASAAYNADGFRQSIMEEFEKETENYNNNLDTNYDM